jgi:putative ABC transport system permease protein
MGKTFFRNLYRDIKNSLSRFLSIIIIIAVGVAFYSGVRSTSPDMKRSGDYYFKKNKLMDFKLISTLGLTEGDVEEIRKIQGVTQVQGAYSLDAVIKKNKRMLVLNINSLPEEKGINDLRLVRGRRTERREEAVVEERFFKENKLKVGDRIALSSGNESNLKDKLTHTEFEIVGTAQSPLYVSGQRQLSSVGSGTVRGFVYILPEVFKSEVYTEIYIKTDSEESANSLLNNENYKMTASLIEKRIKDLGAVRRVVRYEQVLKEAEEKIMEAEVKLRTSRIEAEEKIAEGYRQLEEAKVRIARGAEELRNNEIIFKQGISEGEKAIAEGKRQIEAGKEKIDSGSREIEEGKLQIASAKNTLEDSEKKLLEGKEKASEEMSTFVGVKAEELKEKANASPLNPIYAKEYNYLSRVYENDVKGKDFDTMYRALEREGALVIINEHYDIGALKKDFDEAAADISAGKAQLSEKEGQLLESESELEAGRLELQKNKKKIAAAEIELNEKRQVGISKLNEGRIELEAAQKEVEEGTEKLKAEEEKAKAQLEEGENQIRENKDKLKAHKKPEWYVLGRSANVGYETYRQDSDRINNIGKAFPLIFFLVAALVSLTTMTRMVQEKRTEIGVFKALGYSRTAIVSHYLIYSLAASIIGSLLGMSLGFRLFPPLIMSAYGSLYTMPETIVTFNSKVALQASMLAVLFTTAAAAVSTLGELREVPASLMRPKPPKTGRAIFLEKVPFIWNRLSFTRKVTARNIFRYKQRFFMTVIGIAACTGLMITGFGIKSGIRDAMERQFNKIYLYDMQVNLTKTVATDEKNSIKKKLLEEPNTEAILFAYTKNSSVKKPGGSEDAYLVVAEISEELNNYAYLNRKGKVLKIDDEGVIVTEKLSKLVNKKVGDSIEINVNDKTFKVKISEITEHYVHHFIYMSPAYYKKITGEDLEFNSFYGLLEDVSENAAESTTRKMSGISGIGSVSLKQNTQFDLNKSIASINTVVLVLIASAGVLAFVVIYNLTNININERKRELATIKLLGFFNKELAFYIYRENIILTIFGSLAGILLGKILSNFVINTAETNVMAFARDIPPVYFLYSVLLTVLFSIVVNLAMYWRFDKIDMIESLKSTE